MMRSFLVVHHAKCKACICKISVNTIMVFCCYVKYKLRLLFQITTLEPIITGLQEAMPKSIGLLPFDGGVAGKWCIMDHSWVIFLLTAFIIHWNCPSYVYQNNFWRMFSLTFSEIVWVFFTYTFFLKSYCNTLFYSVPYKRTVKIIRLSLFTIVIVFLAPFVVYLCF